MAEEESKHTLQVVLLVVDAAHGQGRRAYRRRHQPTVPGTRVKRDLIVATLNTCEGVWARAGGAQVAAGAGGGAGRRERVERRFDQAIAERFT